MAREKVVEWGSNQRVVSAERMAEINRAVKGEGVVHQYYYRSSDCKAHTSRCSDCICWHDEGSGPLKGVRHDDQTQPVPSWRPALSWRWREKPALSQIESLRAENERLREALERALEKLPCPHPITKGLITAKACVDRGDCGCENESSLAALKGETE